MTFASAPEPPWKVQGPLMSPGPGRDVALKMVANTEPAADPDVQVSVFRFVLKLGAATSRTYLYLS